MIDFSENHSSKFDSFLVLTLRKNMVLSTGNLRKQNSCDYFYSNDNWYAEFALALRNRERERAGPPKMQMLHSLFVTHSTHFLGGEPLTKVLWLSSQLDFASLQFFRL